MTEQASDAKQPRFSTCVSLGHRTTTTHFLGTYLRAGAASASRPAPLIGRLHVPLRIMRCIEALCSRGLAAAMLCNSSNGGQLSISLLLTRSAFKWQNGPEPTSPTGDCPQKEQLSARDRVRPPPQPCFLIPAIDLRPAACSGGQHSSSAARNRLSPYFHLNRPLAEAHPGFALRCPLLGCLRKQCVSVVSFEFLGTHRSSPHAHSEVPSRQFTLLSS